jgi:hypothetical protein
MIKDFIRDAIFFQGNELEKVLGFIAWSQILYILLILAIIFL